MTTRKPIHVWFEGGIEDGVLIRRLICEGAEGRDGPRAESWWRLPGQTNLGLPPVLDSFVCSHVLWAAILGQDIVVHGPISRGGLYNMGQLLEIRRNLSPERYPHTIQILPDQIVSAPRPPGESEWAMAAFSGGLDSSFTVVRHATSLAGDGSFRLAGLVMVLGFDAPLHRAHLFDDMRRRAEPLARRLNLPIHPVITNSALLGGRAWPQSAMPLFGSVLANFSGHCAVGLVSAGSPYGTPHFGISHPPVLDVLASNEWFRIASDGGGYGRTDKIEALLPFPEAIAGLRVCWQGSDPSRNCGVCEKCVMTRLNFLAAGCPNPPCFDTPLERAHIANLPMLSTHKSRDLFRTCWNELESRGVTGPEVDLLRQRLSRVPPDHLSAGVQRWAERVRRVIPASARRAVHTLLSGASR